MSDWKLLNTSTASGAANVSFTDLTGYKIFKFVFVDVNPATDGVNFQVEGSTGSYGVTKTSTSFSAYHYESGASASLGYESAHDLAQSTSAQLLSGSIGNGADECAAGGLFLFNPASTTYVKHFYSTSNIYGSDNHSGNWFIGGYFNTTSAISALRFSMSSGNFDGVIKQYGLVAT